MTIEKIKILGAVLGLPAKQQCQSSPFTSKIGPNGLNWQCCLAGRSKTAPSIPKWCEVANPHLLYNDLMNCKTKNNHHNSHLNCSLDPKRNSKSNFYQVFTNMLTNLMVLMIKRQQKINKFCSHLLKKAGIQNLFDPVNSFIVNMYSRKNEREEL